MNTKLKSATARPLSRQVGAFPRSHLIAFLTLLVSTLNPQLSTLFAQGTAFSYSGRLNDSGNPATGLYDLTFSLFANLTGPPQVGSTVTSLATPVTNGLFTVTLDFGANFPGADRFLEIGARTNGPGPFTTLSPRQKIFSVPYAITAANLTGTVPATGLSGTYSSALTLNNAGNSFSGSGASLTSLNAGNISSGSLADARLSANVALLNVAQTFTADKFFSGAQLLAEPGTVATPGFAFAGDPNTGIFEPGTNVNTVAITTGGTEKLRLDGVGRVGIGTTTPTNRLTVAGSGIFSSASAAVMMLDNTSANGHAWTWHALDSGSMQLADATIGNSGTRLLIDTSGKVGIGTASPAVALHVANGTDAEVTGGGYIVAGSVTGENLVIDENEIMARNNGGRANLFLNRYGTTLVGGAAIIAGCPLVPDGDGFMELGGPANRWVAVYAVDGTIQTSDARLKDNIQSLHYGLQTVLSLRPVSFQWKKKSDKGVHLGLIAQEVEPIVPEAVVKDEDPEHPAGMNYSAFTPILIKAVQEQQSLIEQQRAENADLKQRLEKLERLISTGNGGAR